LGRPPTGWRLCCVPEVFSLPRYVKDLLVTRDQHRHAAAEDLGALVVSAGEESEDESSHLRFSLSKQDIGEKRDDNHGGNAEKDHVHH
jgi:hypothetical protein